MPLVSVLMTSYNREKYIAEAIESVINSTYQNWELIIVDDCSNDNTVSIAQSYEKQDGRIKIYINEKNLGDYPNRNKAASYAKGKYLKYLDADDLIYSFGLEQMVRCMEKFSDAALGLGYNVFDPYKPLPIYMKPNESYHHHFFKKSIFNIGPTATIIRKDIFDSIGGFTGKRFVGDSELWLTIGIKYPIVLFQGSLVWWRQHDGQEFQLGNQGLDYDIMNYDLLLNIFCNDSIPISNSERKTILRRYMVMYARKVLSYIFKQQKIMKAIKLHNYMRIGIIYYLRAIIN